MSPAGLSDLQFSNYGFFAVVAFLGYEHLITFDTEVALFWKKQFSGACLLFFVNRYLTLAWAIETAASPLYASPKRSVRSWLTPAAAAFSTLRVYALGRIRSVAALVFILSMMPSITKFAATFCIMLITGLPDHSPDCKTVQGPITKRLANSWVLACTRFRPSCSSMLRFTIVSRSSLITAEVVVLVVTWIATYRRGVISRKAEKQTVAHVVLFNGTTYFLVMLFLNCLQLGFTLASVGPTRKVLNVSEVTTFSEPITSALITRFLFDLQRVNQRDAMNLASGGVVSEMVVSPNTLRFHGMFDSLGSMLAWEEDESTDDDADYEEAQ
ncbi:hypothetical protein GSI_12503 [Ganoderma sinense ZZ0214-1]|uniref:DUF6533 domain-containing protein n=1 Tax=Ganoderma sinense ZZ0214-1 TaxID=1077348 RepID=A0A2G8RSX9_9APHY|nr:hypothetical protein GSI_12503 [Ganoderma sinense ZZ0214-1]